MSVLCSVGTVEMDGLCHSDWEDIVSVAWVDCTTACVISINVDEIWVCKYVYGLMSMVEIHWFCTSTRFSYDEDFRFSLSLSP